jgi:uncharacterized repeat protein (TIGR01451 family)
MTYTLTYELTQEDVDSEQLRNSASVTASSPSGIAVVETAEASADIVQDPSGVAAKVANTPERIEGNIFDVTFTMTLENSGNVTLTDLVLEDDLAAFIAPATLVSVNTPVVSGFDVGIANASYNGTSDVALVEEGAELSPGNTGVIELTIRYDTTDGLPSRSNIFVVNSDELAVEETAETLVIASNAPDILASKVATPTTAILGATVTYTLRFENLLDTIETGVNFVDTLPEGIVYTPGTTVVTGATLAEPAMAGRRLTWGQLDMQPGQVVEVMYQARLVGGAPGDYVNTAVAIGPDGQQLSNVATATITRKPEAVFECSDIIGKVFDDRNFNGYQDGVVAGTDITDQTYVGGKFETPVQIAPNGEPGLPNVRLATPNGTLITTDEYGRYSVPCAALPAEIGSNFFLKLDTRTLPTGFFVTTENPRVVRVTPGTMTRLNFGATLGNLVEIDLMAPAFEQGGTAPTPALSGYVDQLLTQLRSTPSVVRLTYYRAGEDQRAANARLDALEALIRDRWNGQGRYRLTVERIIKRTQ